MINLDEEQARMESMLDRRERMALGVTCTEMIELITRLRQAEKDAARYRWLMENCGKILEPARHRTSLYIPNYCPLSMDYVDVSKHIDEAMRCNK